MGISLNPATILSGQGIDVNSLVQQIIAEQSGQLTVWQAQQTLLATQDGLLAGINNNLINLQTAVAALADPTGALTAQAATSSQPGVLTATAQSTAITGTHQIVVTSLATTGTLYTDPVAAGADASFLASGQTSGSGSSGALAAVNNSNTTLNFDAPVGGANAALTIDGVPFSSSSNTVTGAIQGVTLSLVSQSPANPVTVTVGPDTGQITTAVNNFVSAYNTVVSTINTQYVVDPTGAVPAPPLEGDISLRSVRSSVLTDEDHAIGGNRGLVNLASMGINMNNDGTLTVGLTPGGQTFAQVLAANPSAVQSFFQNSSGTGFANNFNTDLTHLTDPTLGPLNVDLTQNQAEQQDLTTTINNFDAQIAAETTQLTLQYDAVNASLQAYPLLLQEVTQTLGTLGSGTSTSGALIPGGPTLTSGL
jgi:flagellar hook-associated protein 2